MLVGQQAACQLEKSEIFSGTNCQFVHLHRDCEKAVCRSISEKVFSSSRIRRSWHRHHGICHDGSPPRHRQRFSDQHSGSRSSYFGICCRGGHWRAIARCHQWQLWAQEDTIGPDGDLYPVQWIVGYCSRQ